jgi:formyltetrahydrofolate deformylase
MPDTTAHQNIGTLLVSCADRRGLVAALAQVLHGHGANILSADQHRDATAGQFFQRIQFDTSELFTDRNTLERAFAEVQQRFEMQLRLSYADYVPKLALFVSRYDHCLYDLLWRQQSGELRCQIAAIVSNHEDLRPIAQQFGVPFHHFPVTPATKAAQEQSQLELLDRLGVDLVVLARYMQILSREFTEHLPFRIINIHHSFLPAFIGGKPYHQAHERGVKLIGATAHYATAVRSSSKTYCAPRTRTRSKTWYARGVTWNAPCSGARCAGTSSSACWCGATRPSSSSERRIREGL